MEAAPGQAQPRPAMSPSLREGGVVAQVEIR